ncbi:MAG: hypothetical protein J6J33_05330, partial [Clostridia bacterium]|nr:hypothetical protein [Clostridia bacterium]
MEKMTSKCKNCGSELWYNPKRGCLVCKYCESNYFLPTKNDKAILVRQYNAGFHPNQLNQSLNAYCCNGCGNTYYIASDEKSKKCPNCGNSSSDIVQDSGYCADGIIPFKITKEQAAENFLKYVKGLKNAPKDLKQMATKQKLMGVFIPVWNFTYNVSATYSANAVDLLKDESGSYYTVPKPVFGDKQKRVSSLDQSATNVEDDSFLDLFDEDDYAGLLPYFPEYTYGYRVDAIDRDIHDFYYKFTEEAEGDMKEDLRRYALKRHKDISDLSVDAEVNDVFFNFAYVPVYVNTFNYRGKTYKTYISGTTGKVVGKTPKSFG